MKKKELTAVEQLERQILDNWMDILIGKVYIGDLFDQAQEMEKEQIMNAFDECGMWQDNYSDSEHYYNKTFKSE
jgi:hypothetical protein